MAIVLFSRWRPAAILVFDTVQKCVTARCGLSMSTTMPNLVAIAQMAAELLQFSVFQNGGRPPSWILLQVKSGIMTGCGLSMSTIVPNFVTVSQPAAKLLHFVEKFKMTASTVLNLYLAVLDHP